MNIYLKILYCVLKFIYNQIKNNANNQSKSNLSFLNIHKESNTIFISVDIDEFENLNLTPDVATEYLNRTMELIRMVIIRAEAEVREQRNTELRQEYEKGVK